MAIIYETQTDLEREKLKDQSTDVYIKSAEQAATGMTSVVLGSLINDFNNKDSGAMRLASLAASVFGAVKVVQSLFTANKAHNLKLEKERLGPQTIVFPPDGHTSSGSSMAVVGEKPCCEKGNCDRNIQPKTLLEQAEKRLSSLGRE
ncbi:MAG: hypothetical protein AABY33_09140 [Pseudomonadota bacterium]